MSLTAAFAITVASTLVVAATLLFFARRASRCAAGTRMLTVAHTMLLDALWQLPGAEVERYLEEWEADLEQLRERPHQALAHAVRLAANAPRLATALRPSCACGRASLRRRALAHIGVPIRLGEAHERADTSYVFDGTMRWRRLDGS